MYAVLQTSLDQPITREALEAAVMATQTLAKPDCVRLQRELFGFVAEKLSQDDALGLQAALRARNFSTEVVDESELPVLPPPKHGKAIKLLETGVTLIDMYEHEEFYAKEQIVFAAGGRVLHLKDVPYQNMEWVITTGPRGSVHRGVEMVTEHRLDNVPEFRLELFCLAETTRLQWVVTKDALLRVNGAILKLRDHDQLDGALATLGSLLPPDRVNLGIKKAAAGENFLYPSVHAFEEEIIWSLYRMARGGSGAP
jgi:hypothetical protein